MMNKDDPLIPMTPEERRQAIADLMQQLDRDEAQARAEYESKMQLIEQKREMLEDMWRKTYETD